MLSLHLRHVATEITVEISDDISQRNGNNLTVDLRDATMALIDKVAVEKGMSVVDAMSNSAVEIIARWEPKDAEWGVAR